MIAVRLLGQFGIRRGSQPVELASRPAQSLLAYLMLHAGVNIRREKLAGVIWPDATEDNARIYLRQALWRIRKAIGADYLLADRVTVAFNASADYWLDVDVLEMPMEAGWTADRLEETLDVYKGELLPGFYEDWVVLERERLQTVFEQRIRQLLDRLIEEGHWKNVLHWGERWIALGHAPEPAYRALMIAHAGLGDLAGMANAYHRCLQALEEDLGVEPSEETRQFYRHLSAGERPAVSDSRLEPAPATIASSASRSMMDQSLSPPAFLAAERPQVQRLEEPFIGREQELITLEGYLQQALEGSGRVVFVTGEAGQGKTTLLHEFARRAQETHTDLIVANGACPVYTPVSSPYSLFREVLEMLTGDVETAWVAGTISRDQAVHIWQSLTETIDSLLRYGPNLIDTLIPGEPLLSRAGSASISQDRLDRLSDLLDRKESPSNRLSEQGAFFSEVADFLVALSESRPLLLILDDLQWMDPSSIGLMSHLGQRLPESAIMVVGAFRSEEIIQGRETVAGSDPSETSQHPLAMVLAEYKRRFGNIFLPLDIPGSPNGQAFVDALLDTQPNMLDQNFRNALTRHTGGNPLFTVELLREMREQGLLLQDDQGRWKISSNFSWDILPPRVEGVIETRFNRLKPELRQWLEVACVEGETFTAEVIAQTQQLDERQVVKRLSSELDRQHHLIRAVGVSHVRSRRLSRYHFRHHLFQRYLYDHMDEVERTHLHERVGESLEALYGDQATTIAEQLARHFTEAWIPQKAIDYWLRAGERAVQVAAYQEAIDYLSRGLELLDSLPKISATRRQEMAIRIALGTPYIALKGWAAAEVGETFTRAFELCELIGDSPERFLCIWNLWRFHANRGELKIAGQLANQVMEQAEEEQDDSRLLQAHHAFWTNRFYTGNLVTAKFHCEQGINIYNRERQDTHTFLYGGHDPAVCSRCFLAFTLWYLGYPEQALTCINEAIRLARELSHPYTLAYALSFAVDTYLFRREVGEVHDQAREAIDFAKSHGFSSWVAWAMIREGWSLVQQGQMTKGIASMERGLEMSHTAGQALFKPYQLALLAEAYQKMGKVEEGLMFLDDALAAIDQTGEHHYEAEVNRLMGELLLVQDPSSGVAENLFHRALAVARQQSARSWELRSALSLARLWHDQGKKQEAYGVLFGVYDWFSEGLDTSDLQEARILLQELA